MAKAIPHIEFISRALLIEQGRVLMCQNLKRGYYYLPGGHIEPGESAATAARRELIEEAGLRIRVGPLLAVAEVAFGNRDHRTHEINMVFHVEHSRKRPPLAPIQSLEQHLGFAWIPFRGMRSQDVRPAIIRTWLTSRGIAQTIARRRADYSGHHTTIDHLIDGGL